MSTRAASIGPGFFAVLRARARGARLVCRPLALVGWLLLGLLLPAAAEALEPDEILLVANRAVPQGEQLARFYAQQRNIEPQRLLVLDLPAAETMPGERYDEAVVAPVRRFLEEHQLREKVRCIVTFYGVPLRLAPRKNAATDNQELQMLQAKAASALAQVKQVVETLERAVAAKDPLFKPAAQADLPALRARAGAAMERINGLLAAAPVEERVKLLAAARAAIERLGGNAALIQLPEAFDAVATTAPSVPRQQLKEQVQKAMAELARVRQRPFDAGARAAVRKLVAENAGLLEEADIFAAQADYLQPAPIKALDSELSLLWYDQYPHQSFLPNPLLYSQPRRDPARPPFMMVSRLDAPEPGLIREMILGGIAAERHGLQGWFAIDSRGMHPDKVEKKELSYALTDESLRQLADLVATRTKLSVMHDDTAEVFKPGAAQNVALYVGWYKVRNYVPSFKFVPGAVAYHIASFEMISLHDAKEKGWCRGLLLDGAAATIGPVDEPYLFSFPDAQDFFGLLLTGKYTLGETYWLTMPVVNWKMVLIGDPLYNPFGKSPGIKSDDLPVRLWEVVKP